MISRQQVMARLREANYTFVERAKHTELWRKKGSVERVFLTRRDYLDDEEVIVVLTQAGLSQQQVQAFLAAAVNT